MIEIFLPKVRGKRGKAKVDLRGNLTHSQSRTSTWGEDGGEGVPLVGKVGRFHVRNRKTSQGEKVGILKGPNLGKAGRLVEIVNRIKIRQGQRRWVGAGGQHWG